MRENERKNHILERSERIRFHLPNGRGDRVFVHIKGFDNRGHRPAVGDVISYSTSTDARGRPYAEGVAIAGVKLPKKPSSSKLASHVIAVGFLLIVGGAVLVSAIPLPILLIYLVVSVATFGAYAFDKSAAERGAWRTSESTLHLLALVGGWPGALVAQTRLRHKSRKQPFRAVFWTTVVLNCGAFVWFLTPSGATAMNSILAAVA